MKLPFREFLQQNSAIVSDGSITTSLYDKGFYINRSFDELSLTEPQAVREVVRGFKRSGAQLLNTNTFNAIRPKLEKYGLQEQHKEILESAIALTKEVAGDEAYSLGAIGPLGVILEPLGPTSLKKAEDYFAENIQVFSDQKVDALCFLGFHDLKELEAGLKAAQRFDLPVMAHIGLQESMKTSFGHGIKEFIELCEEFEVDALGFAGEVGPSGMLRAVEHARPLTKKPISVAPNAGLPRYVNDEYIYMCNPDYLGKFAKRMFQAGANIVGGHSGVHEQHVKAIKNAIGMVKLGAEAQSSHNFESSLPEAIKSVLDSPQPVCSMESRSKLGQKLDEKKLVVSVEINPPKGVDINKFMEHCQELQDSGVEFVNIPDGARAMARMGSLQLASLVNSRFELEAIPHLTTRDRNLLGLQSDLLGCHVNGVKNILAVTGDPPKLGNCPGATAVYDVDAIGLTHILNRMNQGLDLGGSAFGQPTQFVHGVALNPTARNRELEIQRFKYKVEAGANYAITQPIYDLDQYAKFFEELGDPGIPVIMGIWPLVSLRNAEFLKNEVPGVSVPDNVVEQMKKAGDSKEEALACGVDIAKKTMAEARNMVEGFQVSAPFNRVDIAVDVISSLGEIK